MSEKSRDYAHQVAAQLEDAGIRVAVDDRDAKIGYKIREARSIDRVPYMIVVGEKEAEEGNIAVRDRSNETHPFETADFIAKVAKEKVPVLLVINKIDLLKGNADLLTVMDKWKALLPQAEVFPMSAKENFNVQSLMKRIVELLPPSPPYFGKDALTDKPARFFVTEIIREKILLTYDKEVPYATEVIVEKYDEGKTDIHIMAVVYVERDSQKGIVIGHGGQKLKRVGMESRRDIEKFFGKKVFLEIFVKVEPDWRNRENKLRAFGYVE